MTKLNINEFLHGGDYNPEQWLDTPEILNQDFALFKAANINTVTVGVFSWAKLEPKEGNYTFDWLDDIFDRVEKMHGHVILATPSGARPAWLAKKYPEVLRVDSDGIRRKFGGRHNHCISSPIYRQKVHEINTKLAKHFGKRKSLILWHISNEYSSVCYCDLCQENFRKFLQRKYHTLDNLNHAWWTTFWSHYYDSWDEITAPGPKSETGNKGMNLDWNRFVTDQSISFIDNEIEPLKKLTPNIPVTTNMMAGGAELKVFNGLDYQKISKHLDIISWDSYPDWGNDYQSTYQVGMKVSLLNDFYRSLKHQNFLVMESTPSRVNWQNVNRAKRPGMHELSEMQAIAHGSDGALYFQLRASRGSSEMFHGAVIEHRHPQMTRAYHDVKKLGEGLLKIKDAVKTSYVKAKVAIVYSYDNDWALANCESYSSDKKYWTTIKKHYRYFYENDIPVDIIGPDDDFSSYKLIIDPMHFLMSEAYMNKLRTYVKNGGVVVGTYISGVVDDNVLAYMDEWPKQLQEVYGIEPLETDVLYPSQSNSVLWGNTTGNAYDYCETLINHSAEVLGTYQHDFYKDIAAITKNKCSEGYGYYLACRLSYDFLEKFYHDLVLKFDIKPDYPIRKYTKQITIQVRENSKYRYYYVQNWSTNTQSLDITEPLADLFNGIEIIGNKERIHGYETKIYLQRK
ncbi:beta-galactosidase [Lactobacillus colini]|uniref:Beta-galactosidase n=1 Tax=Lactobacillus colini TaxID=1819254 RepID=A0ABS4MFX1_9LACO|nr:beta-galactosidase [Lactobacillus colini]MBP2058231.1 beta-galactosidase [Lactobacillus colini]